MSGNFYSVKINAPVEGVWEFIRDMNNWAHLIPGYIEHKILNEKESEWLFKTDLGIMKKKIHLKVDIIHWNEPRSVRFNLTGINEKFTGQGYFEAKRISREETLLNGKLALEAQGKIGKVITSIFNSKVPEIKEEFTEEISLKIRNYLRSRK